jgi:hypothetical protein
MTKEWKIRAFSFPRKYQKENHAPRIKQACAKTSKKKKRGEKIVFTLGEGGNIPLG